MKVLLALIVGAIIGAYGLRIYERRSGSAPATAGASIGETTRESAAGVGEAVSEKLSAWHLTPDEIRDDLARTGEVIRTKAQGVGDRMADARIVAVIKAKYVLDQNLSSRAVQVESLDGRVELSGSVPSPSLVSRAVMLALDTDGVRSVTSRIAVRSPGS
jgi:hypothetical protein